MEYTYGEKCFERGRTLIKIGPKVFVTELVIWLLFCIISSWGSGGLDFSVGETVGEIIYSIGVVLLDIVCLVIPLVCGLASAAGVVLMFMAKIGGEDCVAEYVIFGALETLVCFMYFYVLFWMVPRW